MFKEIINDPFFLEYKKYNRCVLDYILLESKDNKLHKEAVLYAMNIIKKKLMEEDYEITINNNMKYEITNRDEFFQIPKDYEKEKYNPKNINNKKPYWYLFLSTPHGTGYNIEDFIKMNNILFPNGKDNLEIYDWNVDWSNYFDEGLEWWGAASISIYDKALDRYVVIFASSTD